MGVYTKVHRPPAVGTKIVKLRRIDVNKMEAVRPSVRSKLVDPCLVAATPPIEAFRFLVSKAATTGGGEKTAMLNDVSRAIFNAKVKTQVYIQLLAEDVGP